jgi:type III restriction enzyme
MPPLVVRQRVKRVVPWIPPGGGDWELVPPLVEAGAIVVKQVYSPGEQPGKAAVMAQVDEARIAYEVDGRDLYSAATELAAVYRLDVWEVYGELRRLYGADGSVPETHLPALARQIEEQIRRYTIEEEEIEVALALVKPGGFMAEAREDGVVYTAEITYQVGKEHLLLSWGALRGHNAGDFGFHYDPYNFDSDPEQDFFMQMLRELNLAPDQVEDIYFTGALTDPGKTDFYVEYRDLQGKTRRYTPDFVVRRTDGRCYIVEIKAAKERDDPLDGEHGLKAMALRRWVDLNPELLKYEMIFTAGDAVAFNQLSAVRAFVGLGSESL